MKALTHPIGGPRRRVATPPRLVRVAGRVPREVRHGLNQKMAAPADGVHTGPGAGTSPETTGEARAHVFYRPGAAAVRGRGELRMSGRRPGRAAGSARAAGGARAQPWTCARRRTQGPSLTPDARRTAPDLADEHRRHASAPAPDRAARRRKHAVNLHPHACPGRGESGRALAAAITHAWPTSGSPRWPGVRDPAARLIVRVAVGLSGESRIR